MRLIMKKVFKINILLNFLVIFVSNILIFCSFYNQESSAATLKIQKTEIPIKRPANVIGMQESSDTIYNMVQKVGAKITTNIKETKLRKDENLSKALMRIEFDEKSINSIINSIYKIRNGKKILSSLPVGMKIDYSKPTKLTGGALKLHYTKTNDIFVWQDLENNYISKIFFRPTELEKSLVSGKIKNSLYLSAKKSGMPEETLLEMINLLGFSVDFQREIREGDTFEVMFTKRIDLLNHSLVESLPISYVSINLSGKKISFFKHYDKHGSLKYYDHNGKSSKRTIMKTPINGAKLTSRYGNRKHPILGYTKMHRGLDFAAPKGTPVFAAGDGIIERAGWNGAYGRYIRIRHTGTYKTAYAHLSRIHKKIRVGKKVLQGKVIGYVGNSGRSTGPHLHYEVLRNNIQINPMKLKLPAGNNINKDDLVFFKTKIQQILQQKFALEKMMKNKKIAKFSKQIEKFY